MENIHIIEKYESTKNQANNDRVNSTEPFDNKGIGIDRNDRLKPFKERFLS